MENTLLKTLASLTSLAIASTDTEGRVIYYSPALRILLGTDSVPATDEDLAAMTVFEIDQVTRMKREDLPLVRARNGETVRGHIMAISQANEGMRFLRTDASPIRTPDGTLGGAVGIVQDVTSEYGARLREADLRDRLVETINHQLRTPLTAAVGHVELLADMDLPDQAQRSIAVLRQSTARLQTLLQQVSELVDVEAAAELSKTYVDLMPYLKESIAWVKESLAARELTLTLDTPESLMVTADVKRVCRAVDELLRNAVQYAPRQSRLTLQVEGGRRYVRIEVRDQGSGISPEDRTRVIRPFETAEHPQRPVDSRGLGLAFAHSIATAHGGWLTLRAAKPTGLTAVLWIPRYGAVGRAAPETP